MATRAETMTLPVVTYEDLHDIASRACVHAKRLVVWAFGVSFRLALSAARALRRPGAAEDAFAIESATLFFEDGKAVCLPLAQAEIVVAKASDGMLDDVDDAAALEVRYRLHSRKFRAIARKGEKFPEISKAREIRSPKILSATLVSVPEKDVHLDCTSRVLKYLGPAGDFHGSTVRIRDLFPNHDVAFLAARGYDLVVIDDRLHATTVPFEEDAVVSDLIPAKRA